MLSRNESERAQARPESEAPVPRDLDLLKLQEQVEDYIREAKHRSRAR